MRAKRKEFTLLTIKNAKKEILDELFPRDKKLAFSLHNCVCLQATDNYKDNLFRFEAKIPRFSKGYFQLQEQYIFANYLLLKQLETSKQWFIDGTFSVAPSGFQQLITIVVCIPDCKIFCPAAYILATNKTETIYISIFKNLLSVAEDEGFKLKLEIVTCDFEKGLENAKKKLLTPSNKPIVCYFHYVKALIKKGKELKLNGKDFSNKNFKILPALLKLYSHCPSEKKEEFFAEIKTSFKPLGKKYDDFVSYFERNWTKTDFLKSLFDTYKKNTQIN